MRIINIDKKDYGICECGGLLRPNLFREEEMKIEGDYWHKTGRTRLAVSHLTCENCFRNYPVDDSFDGPWHY